MLPSQPPQASKHLDWELVEQVASGIKDKQVGHVEPLDTVVHDSLFHHDGPLCQELWTTHSLPLCIPRNCYIMYKLVSQEGEIRSFFFLQYSLEK